MKIDTSSGRLTFEAGIIGAHVARSAFLATDLGKAAMLDVANQGWNSYSFDMEPGIRATAYFKDERLAQVSISFRVPGDAREIPPADREDQRKAKHDEWLRSQLGKPPNHYDWGQIDSEFDPKAWSSEIVVLYDPPRGLWDRVKRRLRYIAARLQEID